MKDLRDYLVESKTSLTEFLNTDKNDSIDEGKVEETVVKDKDGKDVTIIGKPFTTDRDERYIMAMDYCDKHNIKVDIDLIGAIKAHGKDADEVEHWVLVKAPNSAHVIDADLLDIPQDLFEAKEGDTVFAIVDFTDAIQGVFPTEDEAKAALQDMPKEAEAKIKPMKKSEVES